MNRRSAKSQPSRAGADQGSAVVEFALIAVPLCLVFTAAMALCTNVYIDSTMRFEAIASARFAALADISAAEATIRAEQRCSKLAEIYAPKCLVGWQSGSRFAVAEFSYQPLGFLYLQPKRVVINAAAALETAK